jgi:hypothetical protein
MIWYGLRDLKHALAQKRVEGRVSLVAQTKECSVPVYLFLMDDGTVEWSRHSFLRRTPTSTINAAPTGVPNHEDSL